MNVGVHGSNGINPQTSYKIYQCYVLPRLLYGLEILPMNNNQLQTLKKFHIKNLRNFQSLPTRTALSAVYLLIGALPIEGELHKRQLSFLNSILTCENETIRSLIDRQIVMNSDNPTSFFYNISEVLERYKLPDLQSIIDSPQSKESWKKTVKKAVNNYWQKFLLEDTQMRTTLANINKETLGIGRTHPVWACIESNVSDLQKGIIKARLLTGTYILQSLKYKYSKGSDSNICKCCNVAIEDLEHFLLFCSALYEQRKPLFAEIKSFVISKIGPSTWENLFSDSSQLMKLIIDCSFITPYMKNHEDIDTLHRLSCNLCYRLHAQRTWLLSA